MGSGLAPRRLFSVQTGKERDQRRRRGTLADEDFPFGLLRALLHHIGDSGEHGGVAQAGAVEIAQGLEIDEGAVERKPVEHFIKQTGVVTRPLRAAAVALGRALGLDLSNELGI